MDIDSTRRIMITNRNVNSIIKPNIVYGKYSISSGMNTDGGIGILNGKINHHTAMILDIIYDHLYRMFNVNDEMHFIESSLKSMLYNNDGKRYDYFKTLITDKKLDFYTRVLQIGKYFIDCQNSGTCVPYTKSNADFLLNDCPHVIENAFGPEFSIPYKAALESQCEHDQTLDKALELLRDFKFERSFFKYLLNNIFYGKYPQWNNFHLKINLNSIFENNERTVYVIKDWLQKANDLKINMTYPVTCFSDQGKGLPKKLFLKSYMMPIVNVSPIQSICDKNMIADISLSNKFMVFFAHDAKMCVVKYMPSALYSLNSNAYFLGKAILNNTYYSKYEKGYINKMNYSMGEMFEYLNLPEKDNINGNSSYRKKAIFKALKQLDDKNIIKISKITSDRIKLNYVWSIKDMPKEESCIDEDI